MLFPWTVDIGTSCGELSLRDCKTALPNHADSPLAEDAVSLGRFGSQKLVREMKGRASAWPIVYGVEKPSLS